MELTDKQWIIFDFIKQEHQGQARKYTGEPYFVHLFRVAEILDQYSLASEIEIGFCHDILEKTSCTKQQLAIKLKEVGYDLYTRSRILKGIYDMTDIFTREKYPDQNRAELKQMEMERMMDIEPFSQNVKYAELLDNIPSIVKYDPHFAKVYLSEVSAYLDELNEGDKELYAACRKVLDTAKSCLVE